MDAFAETLAAQAVLPAIDTEAIDVYCWRVEQLERAGYTEAIAHLLAENAQVDLHAACRLLARGCPEHLAYRILS
jgi:hypothetical protein